MRAVFSGFRDDALKQQIINDGGTVTTAVSGLTTIVIVKDSSSESQSVTKARDMGIKVVTKDEFVKASMPLTLSTPAKSRSKKAPTYATTSRQATLWELEHLPKIQDVNDPTATQSTTANILLFSQVASLSTRWATSPNSSRTIRALKKRS